jgi:hypothetical protein
MENHMTKAWMLLPLAVFAASAAQAGTYAVLQESDCPLISGPELSKTISKVGTANGLNLPRDMALRAELHCARVSGKSGGGYVYTFRAAIQKQLADGEMQRWAPVAELTGFGTSSGSTMLLRDVGYTVRDLIRQEP